jgi:hypothetical protein
MPRALRLKGAEKAYALEEELSAPEKRLEDSPFGAGRRCQQVRREARNGPS